MCPIPFQQRLGYNSPRWVRCDAADASNTRSRINPFLRLYPLMRMTKATHRFASWIACFAILMASLAPSISHAVAAGKSQPNAWMEICTVMGSKMVALDISQDMQTPAPVESMAHLEHCPFCLNHAVSVGLPPPPDFVMPVISGDHVLPSLFYQSSRPLFAWAVAQPRAPPAIS